MNPENKYPHVERQKVEYIHQKLRYLAREIETSSDVKDVFERMYAVDTEQVVELVKMIICRDSRLLTVPGHDPIDMKDFSKELDIQIRDMLDTVLNVSTT